MNARPAALLAERMVAMGSQPKGGDNEDSDRELMLEDARSIRDGWHMVQLA